MSKNDLQQQHDELTGQLAAINLAAARARVDAAKTKRDRLFQADSGVPNAPSGPVEVAAAAQRELDAASEEWKRARGDLVRLESEDGRLRRELAHVGAMLNAADQGKAAEAAVREAEIEVTRAQNGVGAAAAALERIEQTITAEEQAFATARDAAGARILEAAKSGGDVATIEAPNRGKIEALQQARQGAQAELADARKALAAAQASLSQARRRVDEAHSLVAEGRFLRAEREYREALHALYVAKGRLGGGWGGVADPRTAAMTSARPVIEAEAMEADRRRRATAAGATV